MKPFDNIVDFKDVDLFCADRKVFNSIHFSLSRGEFCYITGPTGSGKTTFLKALYAHIPIRNGTARVFDHDLGRLPLKSLPYYRRKLGIIFQQDELFSDWSVFENLDFVLRATDWKSKNDRLQRIKEVLIQVGLTADPEDPVDSLSGGQKKLVALARAVLNKPGLILADEPTGGLDRTASARMMQVLKKMALEYQASVIVATHDEDLRKRFPARSYRCERGMLVELNFPVN